MKDIVFESVKEENKYLFQEAKITLDENNSPILSLSDLFFRPKEVLGEEVFNKIFLSDIETEENHKKIIESRNNFPWNGWVFRGLSNSSYALKTSFERLCFHQKSETDIFQLEQGLIRNFKRNLRAFHPNLSYIKDDDIYEHMALLQHFGGATRFLDVTYSFFVALFFATWNLKIENNKEKKSFSIWCFNRMWIEKRYKDFLPEKILRMYNDYDKFGKDVRIQKEVINYIPDLLKSYPNLNNEFLSVINMSPFYSNTRMIRQQGMFLMPTNPYHSFEENLFNMVGGEKDSWRLLKVTVQYDDKSLLEIKKCLNDMNINKYVLFDSLDSLCESINEKTNFPDDSLAVSPNAGISYPTNNFLGGK